MKIGIDLDNTLANYAAPLRRLCAEEGINATGQDPKLALRDWLRQSGRECVWTRLQGELYGPLMTEASLFPGAAEFLHKAGKADVSCAVVSHRTRYPIAGQDHDLHASARHWLQLAGLGGIPLYLEETQSAKLARIADLRPDAFIDDLPELLLNEEFPQSVRPILFDPQNHHPDLSNVDRVSSWQQLSQMLLA